MFPLIVPIDAIGGTITRPKPILTTLPRFMPGTWHEPGFLLHGP